MSYPAKKTFRISKNIEPKIGDIVIHEKDSISKIVDVQVKNEVHASDLKNSALEIKSNSSGSKKSFNKKNYNRTKINENLNDELIISDNEKFKDEKVVDEILNITVHRTDKLLLNSLVIHPVVKIHIVDAYTGNYLAKKTKERSVVYYYEDNLEYIAPIMTCPYNMQEKRSLIPLWDETILINEDYDYIIEQKDKIIIFFEILDFVSLPLINNKTKGWHRIAFAFLKISGKNNVLNLKENMRLQLYHCSLKKEDTKKCSIWEVWNNGKLVKYPSSLYVSITATTAKNKLSTALRSSGPLEKETRDTEIFNEELLKKDELKKTILSSVKATSHKNQEWKRSTSEDSINLPNECLAQFETGKEGCFTLRFSHSGSFLACSLKLNNLYCIGIFSIITFEQVCYLPGHQDIIYSIRWSLDDSLIIACSADCSVSIWNVFEVSFLQILPHPNFVYANEMGNNLIATGCYDTKLRIWNIEGLSSKYVLNQELEGHKGYITSLLFKKSYNTILSSDSLGLIIEWYHQKNTWILHKKINILGLESIVINQIEFTAREKRLVVHSRDNILRIMDLESSTVLHWLQGGLNTRFHTSCSISPCGNYVVAGSENSSVNIWKLKTGKYVGSLVPYKNKAITIHALQFHPKDNIMAVGHFGDDLPVLLFGYNAKNTENNIDLRLIMDKRNDLHDVKYSRKQKSIRNNGVNLDFTNVLDKLDNLMGGKRKSFIEL